jgi:cobalt transporter subunit CbtB
MTVPTGRDRAGEFAFAGQRVLQGTLALLIGAFLVWGAGFAGPSTLHEAAHDARHSLAFPCH